MSEAVELRFGIELRTPLGLGQQLEIALSGRPSTAGCRLLRQPRAGFGRCGGDALELRQRRASFSDRGSLLRYPSARDSFAQWIGQTGKDRSRSKKRASGKVFRAFAQSVFERSDDHQAQCLSGAGLQKRAAAPVT
jgi:hypothetical protein